eukprot:scaffold421372_cov69-Attheya_sp.AAC.6
MSSHATAGQPQSLVIIGAGVASIKLAHTVAQADPSRGAHITILEANDHVGGRIRHKMFCGHCVEMGANWISGREDAFANPVWDLAKTVELQGHTSDRDHDDSLHVMDCHNHKNAGSDVTKQYLETVTRFQEIHERAVAHVTNGTVQNDASVRDILEECGWMPKSLMEKAVEHNVLEVWVSDGLERLSAAHDLKAGANDVDLGNDEMFVEDPRGFNCILDRMVEDLKVWGVQIHLQTKVQMVHYKPGNVKVVAQDETTGLISEYKTDAVVSTVSLGVLQSKSIKFLPPFPKWKIDAIGQLAMFNFAKVFCKFETKFWPDKDQLRSTFESQHLFMCYLGGAEARRVECLTTEQIADEVEELFRRAFEHTLSNGQDPTLCFRPSSVAVTDWSNNPMFRGSYSVYPVGAFADVPFSDLTKGLNGVEGHEEDVTNRETLYFAGEAFDDKFNGWVQGAYMSGERLAKKILERQ